MKQRDIAAYVQGALLELYLFQKACREGPRWMRPTSSRVEGGALWDAVLMAKAVLLERNDDARRQVAREMVTGMRLYYGQVLKAKGVSDADAEERSRSAFGNAGVIVNEAVKMFGDSVPARNARLARLLGRNSLE